MNRPIGEVPDVGYYGYAGRETNSMNRPLSDIPDVNDVGRWALQHWLDSPSITITTNQGEIRHEFVPENASQRDGVAYTFEMAYVLVLYEAEQGDLAVQQMIRRGGE